MNELPSGELPSGDVPERDAEHERRATGQPQPRTPAETLTRHEHSEQLRHYRGEFNGQILDLYTDGTRWASSEQAEGDKAVGPAPDRAPAGHGDVPPTGEQLLHLGSDKASRAERMRREGYRSADDILAVSKQWAEVGHDLLARKPPAGYTAATTRPEITPVPQEGLNPGDTASALLVFSALTAEAIGKGVKSWHERKGHDDGRER